MKQQRQQQQRHLAQKLMSPRPSAISCPQQHQQVACYGLILRQEKRCGRKSPRSSQQQLMLLQRLGQAVQQLLLLLRPTQQKNSCIAKQCLLLLQLRAQVPLAKAV
jgi:hypothetical protein